MQMYPGAVESTCSHMMLMMLQQQQQQQQRCNPQQHDDHHCPDFNSLALPATAALPQQLPDTSRYLGQDQVQKQLPPGCFSEAEEVLGAVMHTIQAELQRELHQIAGAALQRHKQTLLKEIQSLSLTAATSRQSCKQAAGREEAGPSNIGAATSTKHSCSCCFTTTVEGAAAVAGPGCCAGHNAAAGCSSSSPPLPLATSGSYEAHSINLIADSAAAAAAATAVIVSCSRQPIDNLETNTPAAGDPTGQHPSSAEGTSDATRNIGMSPFAHQCQQAAVCHLLQAPPLQEQQQQQQQAAGELSQNQVQPAPAQQQQAITDASPFAAPMRGLAHQPTCSCQHQQQQQRQLPSSPADVSQHSMAAAPNGNAAAENVWQHQQISDEDMQQLLDAIDSDTASATDDTPISENIFADIDELMDGGAFSDFAESCAQDGLMLGPSTELALLQLSSLPQESQQQLEKMHQLLEAQQQQQQDQEQAVVQPVQRPLRQQPVQPHLVPSPLPQPQQLQPPFQPQFMPQQQHPQQQQLLAHSALRLDASAAPSVSPDHTSYSPLTSPYSYCVHQLPIPCSQPVWQQQQQQQTQQWQLQQSMVALTSASSDTHVCNSNSSNGKAKRGRGRPKGRAAAAAAAAKIELHTQQQKKKRSHELDTAVAPLKRAHSDIHCASSAFTSQQCSQWTQPQLQQQWSMPAPYTQPQQQLPATSQASFNLAAQLPLWLTRQVAVTQFLVGGTC